MVSPGDSTLDSHLLHPGAGGKQQPWQAPFSSGCALMGIHGCNPQIRRKQTSPPAPDSTATMTWFPKTRGSEITFSSGQSCCVFAIISFPPPPPHFLFFSSSFSTPAPSLQPNPSLSANRNRERPSIDGHEFLWLLRARARLASLGHMRPRWKHIGSQGCQSLLSERESNKNNPSYPCNNNSFQRTFSCL